MELLTSFSEDGECCCFKTMDKGINYDPSVFIKKANEKKRFSKICDRNPEWKGDKVGYVALHNWVKRRSKKTELCECCGVVEPKDLANKGVYDRDLNNWEWLCRKCHMIKDGRLKNLIKNGKKSNIGRVNTLKRLYEYRGEKKTLICWSRELGINYVLLKNRRKYTKNNEELFTIGKLKAGRKSNE